MRRGGLFVITGGGTGIGRALAVKLAERGQRVLIIGRRAATLIETATSSPLISYLCVDVASAEGREKIVNELKQSISLAGLINNAATIEPIIPVATVDETSWNLAVATNLNAPLFLTQLLLSKLKHGRILNIGSGAAYTPITGWSAYCVSKAALSMLTRCWQLENQHIAIASVMPGIIDTDMQKIIRQARFMDEEKRSFFQTLKAKDHLISPKTVALFLSWLLLDVSKEQFVAQEWDIYNKNHHTAWLIPPHKVPALHE